MNKGIEDGGPVAASLEKDDGSLLAVAVGGLSVRDWFAGMALQGILSNPCLIELHEDYNLSAKASLNFADAMLAARKEGGKL